MIKIAPVMLALTALVLPLGVHAEAPSQWQGTVARMIASRQTYPRSAQIRGDEGTTRLRVALTADGQISQVDLAQSSGSAILDREAQAVVTGIKKFPAPPPGISSLLVPIVWRLN